MDTDLEGTPLASKSEVETFEACQRQWVFKYVLRIRTPQTDSQKLGDDVDSGQLQPYYRDGREFDYTRPSGYIAASALAHLPPRDTPGAEVQKWFILPSASSKPNADAPFGFRGALDLWVPGSADALPTIYDFKTTSNLKWAKSEKQLREDHQVNLYATWAMYETGSRAVDCVWVYMQTKGARKSKRVHLRVTADEVIPKFLAIDATARSAFTLRKSLIDTHAQPLDDSAALSLPPNPLHCEAFGGCPFRDRCNLSPDEEIEALTTRHQSPAQLRGIDMSQPGTGALFANLRKRADTHFGAPETAPAPTEPPAWTKETAPYAGVQVVGINPPESKTEPPAAPVGVTTAAPEPAKRKPGRPKKSEEQPSISVIALSDPTAQVGVKCHDELLEPVCIDGETVTATWGEERITPAPFNTFCVGPFSITGKVRAGESRGEALRRLNKELYAFAIEATDDKAEAFKRSLDRLGVGK